MQIYIYILSKYKYINVSIKIIKIDLFVAHNTDYSILKNDFNLFKRVQIISIAYIYIYNRNTFLTYNYECSINYLRLQASNTN